eukprot:scaffold227039_cov39-Prasinocladus_malaysianus.AAC.2
MAAITTMHGFVELSWTRWQCRWQAFASVLRAQTTAANLFRLLRIYPGHHLAHTYCRSKDSEKRRKVLLLQAQHAIMLWNKALTSPLTFSGQADDSDRDVISACMMFSA